MVSISPLFHGICTLMDCLYYPTYYEQILPLLFSAFTCFSTPIQSLEPDLHSVTKSLSDFNSICIDSTNYFGRNYRILFLPKIVHALIFIYFNVFQLRFNTFSKRILHLLNLTEATLVSKFCIH